MYLTTIAAVVSSCSSSGDSIDKLFGSNTPILSAQSSKSVSQTDLLKIDVNNIRDGEPGTDEDMTYTCYYDRTPDGTVLSNTPCAAIPHSAISFNSATGVLEWTPAQHNDNLGEYEIKITGISDAGESFQTFNIGVRLKFGGVSGVHSITGISAGLNWVGNANAAAYQIFVLNSITGLYELHQTVVGGATTGATATGFSPNTNYTVRVNAVDTLGFLDTNSVSTTFVTTELVKFTMSTNTLDAPAGTPVNFTITTFNSDDSPQTIGGLSLTTHIDSGTTSGNFSPVTDNNNGTYSFTFTPTTVGTNPVIVVATNTTTYFLNNTITLSARPGPANSANSSISSSSNTTTSGNFVEITSQLRDQYNNPISSGVVVTFGAAGAGTSTGTFGAVTNQGNGVYKANYTGVLAGTAKDIVVLVDGSPLAISTPVTVTPGVVSSATSTLAVSSPTILSGTDATVTATLRDAAGNLIPSGVLVTFNKTGGSSTGNFGAVTNNGDGTYTTTYTGILAGSAQTLTVSVDGQALTPTTTIAVLPGTPHVGNSSFSLSAATVVSGNFVTATATIKDVNHNPIESGITVDFTKTGGTSTGNFNAVTNQGNGVYTIRYTGIVAGTAQNIHIQIGAVNFLGPQTITVLAASPDPGNSSLAVTANTVQSGNSVTFTATVRDLNNNPIASGYTISFSKAGGTSTGNFSGVTNNLDGTYTIDYTGVIAGSAQTVYLLVDSIGLGPTETITVLPGAPSSILSTLTVSSNTITAGTAATLTATIKDSSGNPISAGIVVGFDKFGGTSTGTYSAVTNQGNGVYTATYTGHVAGTAQTVQANVDLAGFGPTQSIQVVVGVPNLANSSLSVSAATVASGSAVNVNAVLRDSENNPITNQYTITFDAIGGSSTGTLAATNNGGGGNFSTTYPGVIAGTAQTIRVFYDGIQVVGLTDTVAVIPGPVFPANSSFTISNSASAIVQSTSSADLSISIRDANNNAISDVATAITFNKTAAVSDGNISAITNNGNGNYSGLYVGTTTGTAQTVTLIVNGTNTGMSITATVTAGPPTQIAMTTIPPGPLNSIDCNGPYIMTLRDANNNTTFSVSPVTVSLTSLPVSSHVGTIFNDANCVTTPATQLTIPVSTPTKTFYYKSYRPQSITLTLSPNLSIASTDVTLANIPVVSWIGASAQFTMSGSGTQNVYDHTGGGLDRPSDMVIDGNFMYVADSIANRIVKYNLLTNTVVGWIGHISSSEGIAAFDASAACDNLAVGDLTPKWCTGGQSNQISATLLNTPTRLATDGTYLYVATAHRIQRYLAADGSYHGWYGRINNRAGMSDDGVTPNVGTCWNAGNGNTTPQWCFGGTNNASTGDGQFNSITGLTYRDGYLYITDYDNHRIQRLDVTGPVPVFSGWIGRIGSIAGMTDDGVGGVNCINAGVGGATPQWCYGGTAQVSRRYQLATTPVIEAAPPEGFRNPTGTAADATYLYISDANNYRIVRVNRAAGTFEGWIGPVRASNVTNPTVPVYGANQYTSTWTTGGVVSGNSNGMGFNWIQNMYVDEADNMLYYADQNGQRVAKVSTVDGSGMAWIGRNSASPTGGNPGCSSTPVNGTNPGWCTGGAAGRFGNANGTFYNPLSVVLNGTKIYVVDSINARVQRFNKVSGTFDGWIGAGSVVAQTWARELEPGTIPARSGFDDYSFMENANGSWYMGIAADPTGTHLYHGDNWHRIKKFNFLNGSIVGYVGVINNFGPTGPAECVGYTSGFTPTWCTGGGRTQSGGGVHGYNNPFSVAADGTYVYVASYSNGRIDRILASDGTYMGWLGRIATSPTDGESTCNGAGVGTYTPGWCIGGTAGTISNETGFNNPRAVYYDVLTSVIYTNDSSGRLIRINPATGAMTGVTGGVSAGAGGCTISGNVASEWCTTSATGVSTNNYGGINNGAGIAANTNYIFVADMGRHRVARFEKVTGSPAGFLAALTNTANVDVVSANFTVNALVTPNGCLGLGGGSGTPGWCIGTGNGVALNIGTGTGDSQFNSPRGIWADDSHVFVADHGNNRLMKFDAATGVYIGWKGYIADATGMTCLSGIPVTGSVTPDWCTGGLSGPGTSLGGFNGLSGLWGDASYIYVVDTRNNRIVTIPR